MSDTSKVSDIAAIDYRSFDTRPGDATEGHGGDAEFHRENIGHLHHSLCPSVSSLRNSV